MRPIKQREYRMKLAINPNMDLNNFDEVLKDIEINLYFVTVRFTECVSSNGKKYTNLDIYTKGA
jgi:hypothetical protein